MTKNKFSITSVKPSSSSIKALWLDQLFSLEEYLYRTMGHDNMLCLPFCDEESSSSINISSRMGIIPTRDGKQALDTWASYYATNRIIRALVDRLELFEARWADSTTYMMLLCIAILKTIYRNESFDQQKELIQFTKDRIIDSLPLLKGRENQERYIRTAISCMDKESIDAIVDLIMNNPDSHIQIVKNGYPKYAEYSGHIAVEKSDSSKILTLHSLPSMDFNGKARVLVVNGVITFDSLANFIERNNHFIEIVCKKAEEEGDLISPLIILARHVDYGSKKLLDLTSQYGIILIAHNNNSSLECRNILSTVTKTICVDLDQEIDPEFLPEVIRIALKTVEAYGNKVLFIQEEVDKSFLPNEKKLIEESIQNELRHPLTEERRSVLATMKNLIASSGINVFLGGFSSRYEKQLYYDKLHDVVMAFGLNLIGKTTPCIYKTLSLLIQKKEDGVDQKIWKIFKNMIEDVLDQVKSICYSQQEMNSDDVVDLYDSIFYATAYACEFSWDIVRTVFMQKFDINTDKDHCIFDHEECED